jgi:phosphoglucosamine mutase
MLRALGERPLRSGDAVQKLPQVLVNVPVADREGLAGSTAVREAIESESAELAGEGRILVRPSGTEPLVRVMVEAPTQERCETVCARVAAVVERELGVRG